MIILKRNITNIYKYVTNIIDIQVTIRSQFDFSKDIKSTSIIDMIQIRIELCFSVRFDYPVSDKCA